MTGLALYNGQGPLGECSWESRRNHTAQLLPQLDLLLRHVGVARSDLTAVAVALGPGSWSGLRVGMSVAKGLAMAGGLALIGISTLDALAYQQHARGPIYPLLRLGRDRFATAEFRNGDHFERRSPDRNLSLAELCSELTEQTLFCGDLDEATEAQILRCMDDGQALFPGPAARLRRPAYLAELAWARISAGERDNLDTLEPVYLGEPVKPKA